MVSLNWHKRALMLLPLATSLAHAASVSLANFGAPISGLPTRCDKAYRTTIPGCTTQDFTPPSAGSCSQACLNGLVQINALVNANCAGVDAGETSIIGLFQSGQAIQALCSIKVVTATVVPSPIATATAPKPSSATTTQIIGSSIMVLPSTISTSSALVTESARPPIQPTLVPSGVSSSSTGILQGPSSPPKPTGSATKAEPASSSPNSGDSGGGSPFDNTSGSAEQFHGLIRAVMASVVVLGFLTL